MGSWGPQQAGDSRQVASLPRQPESTLRPSAQEPGGTEVSQSPAGTLQDRPHWELLLWTPESSCHTPWLPRTRHLGTLTTPTGPGFKRALPGTTRAATFLSLGGAGAPTTQPMFTMGRSPPGLGTKRSLDVSRTGLASWCCLTSASDSSRSRTQSKCCLKQRCPWAARAGQPGGRPCP